MMNCKYDQTQLIVKKTKNSSAQQLKSYYYTAYLYCPSCKRIYHDDAYRIVNNTLPIFTPETTVLTHKAHDIWTDGACVYNGTPLARASWGFVSGTYEEAGPVEGKQTNNRGEAYAIYYALKWAAKKDIKSIAIHTDSQITIHGVMKDYLRVKENRDIFEKIANVISENNLLVTYVKVRGHSDDVNNNRADAVATGFLKTS